MMENLQMNLPVTETTDVISSKQKVWCYARKIVTKDRSVRNILSQKDIAIATFKVVIEQIYKMTVEEYDKCYSTELNQKLSLEAAIKKIVDMSDIRIRKECVFDNKRMLFRMCWPEYYHEHYKTPTACEIFLMKDGTMKGNFVRVGKLQASYTIDENGKSVLDEKKNDTSRHYGNEIDQMIYNAIEEMWPLFFKSNVEEQFMALAEYKKNGLDKFAKCMNVIMARGIYPSPLDFYMWNSSAEFQMEHFEEYIRVREKTRLKPIPYLNILKQAIEQVKNQQKNR